MSDTTPNPMPPPGWFTLTDARTGDAVYVSGMMTWAVAVPVDDDGGCRIGGSGLWLSVLESADEVMRQADAVRDAMLRGTAEIIVGQRPPAPTTASPSAPTEPR